ncbi:MAG: hypothetical protein VX808_01290, partial [Actinomycetota bacterium]|nr:hypothetical protein [Actinomycetota bacterium]
MTDQTTLDATPSTDEPVISVTEAALAKVLEVRAGEDEPTSLALQIDVTGVSGVDYVYDLAFT